MGFTTAVPGSDENSLHALKIKQVALHHWSTGEGKMWTDLELSLYVHDGVDHIKLSFAIKMNVTHSPQSIVQRNKKHPALVEALHAFIPDQYRSSDSWSPQDFYTSTHMPVAATDAAGITLGDIGPALLPFQKRAVQWALRRERFEWRDGRVQPVQAEDYAPFSFQSTKDATGCLFYVSHLFGMVTRDPQPFHAADSALRGGILAEEMGLGKTVETISLIMLNRRAASDASTIYDDRRGQTLRTTAATLIITPPSILGKSLNTFLYCKILSQQINGSPSWQSTRHC